MYSPRWSAIRTAAFNKWLIPWWILALGVVALAAGTGGGAVGAILSGVISSRAGLVVEQSVVIDRENFTSDDILSGLPGRLVTFNDEGSSFTVAAEMHTGDDLVIDVPLANRSEFNANMIAKVEVDSSVQHDVEVFWNTLTRSTQPVVSNSTPDPTPITSTTFQSSDTTPSSETLPGVAGVAAQVSNGTPTNSSPGLPASAPQTANSTRTNSQPSGGASVSTNSANAGTKTNTQPTGSASISAQTANAGVKTTTQPAGSAAITSNIGNGTATTTQPAGTVSIDANTADGTATTTQPSGSATITSNVGNGTATTTDPSGTVSIDANTANGTATTTQPSGSVSVSSIPADSLKGNIQPIGAVSIAANTANGTATTTQPSGAPISKSSTWYIGSVLIDSDGDGNADDTLNFALTDTSATGTYDTLDLSLGDTIYGSSTTNGLVVSGDDERVTSSSDLVYGSAGVTLTTAFSGSPSGGSDDLSLTSKTWYTGSLTLALTDDGIVNDVVSFALSDSNSDATFDTLDISLGDSVFGSTTSNGIVDTNDDERITADTDISFGTVAVTSTVAFDSDPLTDTDDVRLTSKTWYTGSFSMALDADGTLDDTVNFVLSDSNSDGTFDTLDISQGDTVYGAFVSNSIVDPGDDERITSSTDISYGAVNFTFTTAFDNNPVQDGSDASLTAKTWYTGAYSSLAVDADGTLNDTLNFVLSDSDSNGAFDTLDLSLNNTTFGETTGGTLSDKDIDSSTDDERLTSSTSEVIEYGGAGYTATTAFDSNPENDTSDTTLTSKRWYTGSFTLALDADGAVNDTLNFALTDTNSNGTFDALDLSLGDSIFGTTTGNGNVDIGDDEEISATTDIVFGAVDYTFTTAFDNNPVADSDDVRLTLKTWFTGSFSLALDDDGTVNDTVNWALSGTDSDGTFDTLDISLGDATYGQTAGGTLIDGDVDSGGDDERITATSAIVFGAVNHTFTAAFDINPSADSQDVRLTSKTWYKGTFSLALDSDGSVNDTVNFALSDADSNGTFDTLDLSQDDTTFGQTAGGTLIDGDVDSGGDDERITATSAITYGAVDYTFTTAFDNNPEQDSDDARLTSRTWYTGSFTLALDSDGLVDNTVSFALVDTDSDGTFDTLDLSQDDTTFGQTTGGTLSDSDVDSGGDDERITATSAITYGAVDYTFTTAFDNNPEQDSDDARVTSKTWYTGAFTIDADADASADDTINFALSDTNSNGTFDTMDVSLGNTTYGQGGQLSDSDVTTTDDERIFSSTDIDYGSADYRFTTAFDSNPEQDFNDARITAKTHFESNFVFDADASGALASGSAEKVFYGTSDVDSNGLYDRLDLSLGDSTFSEGAQTDVAVTSAGIGGGENDERVTISGTKVKIGTTYTVFASYATNPAGTSTDASILLTEDNTPLKFLGIASWVIDADGDLVADDHVYFVLSDTDSDGIVDTMDISIGDLVFGEGTLTDQVVNYDASNNTNDERIGTGEIVTLGTHNFLIDFDTAVFDDTDDARITSRWYTGTFPVDVDNNRIDNTLDFVIVDHNSDGLYTIMELDGDDSGSYSTTEVHRGAASTTRAWLDPTFVEQENDPSPLTGQYTSIATPDRDTVFIAYYNGTDGDLKFARSTNNGQTFTDSTPDSAGDVGQHTDIEALDTSTIYISYYDATNGNLKFAKSTNGGSSFTTVTVDSSANDVGQYSSISATSTDGSIFISYYDATAADLKIARSTDGGTTWSSSIVDSTGDVGKYGSLDTVHSQATTTIYISYYDDTNDNLKLASATQFVYPTFTVSTVDSTGDVGQYSSIAAVNDTTVDNGQTVYISYYDATSKDLKLAASTNSGSSFTTVTAVSSGDVGKFSSIAVVEPTTIFISYFEDAPANALNKLKTVRSTDSGATFEAPATVDEGQTVGQYNDISLVGTTNVFVSYWDDNSPFGSLKFARSTVLIDLIGHRVTLDWSMDPTDSSNGTLYDGRILQISQLNPVEWLFKIPPTAKQGPNIEQTQIRIVIRAPGTMDPGFYKATFEIRQIDG